MQYMQQSIEKRLVPLIEGNPLTKHFTHFTNQQINKDAARIGSLDGSLATLDLSEASDRVLNQLVIDALQPWPSLAGAVQACRTRVAELDNGMKIPLVKFASMGSALCFPMEAIVFTTLVFMGLQNHAGKKLTEADILAYAGSVHVYGDDIIVPAESVTDVRGSLESFGLKVNHTKSFSVGNFRESCGGDYFAGEWVTPIRARRLPPRTRRDTAEVISWTKMMNAFYTAGFYKAGDYAREVVEQSLRQRLSDIPRDSGALGVEVDGAFLKPQRINPDTQVPEVKALRVIHKKRTAIATGIWALRKVFSGEWRDPLFADHLTYSGRPLSSSIVGAWVPAGP
jgi:hypothetical protein